MYTAGFVSRFSSLFMGIQGSKDKNHRRILSQQSALRGKLEGQGGLSGVIYPYWWNNWTEIVISAAKQGPCGKRTKGT